jgi:ankyrin repeat protein
VPAQLDADGITIRRLIDAIHADDVDAVAAMLSSRPDLVHLDTAENDEHQALHHAVLARNPDIVRLLMQRGADARKGIWPHRDATSALTLATERNYREIVAIIREEEERRSGTPAGGMRQPPAALIEAFQRGDDNGVIAFFDSHPEVLTTVAPGTAMTALHYAAAFGRERLARWLVNHGADVNARTTSGRAPLDVLGIECESLSPTLQEQVNAIGELLVQRGAERTEAWAVVAGDVEWLQARAAVNALSREADLLTHAVKAGRLSVLEALLQLGMDPDERHRIGGIEEVVLSWGSPLRECARLGHVAMAKALLSHGADANTNVYAASSALYEAHSRHDTQMIELLEAHGAAMDATTACYLGLTERARQLFQSDTAESFLQAAADGGHVELVRLALSALDWPFGDVRWQWMLMRPLGKHEDLDRERFLICYGLLLDRSGLNVPWRFGRTPLHDVAADWPRSAPMGPEDRVGFARLLLSKGARLDLRDDLLRSTPLGWACRWGQIELVQLLLEHGAPVDEPDAELWATPLVWAEKRRHHAIAALLRSREAQ